MRSCIETYNMTMNDMNIARYYIDCTWDHGSYMLQHDCSSSALLFIPLAEISES